MPRTWAQRSLMIRARFLLAACLLTVPVLATSVGGVEQPYIPLELKTKAPEWWTPEVRAAAQAAALQGKLYSPLTGEFVSPGTMPTLPLSAPVNIPVGAPDYLFIRPGALALTESGFLCTYNFIYAAGTQIGTAGHCPSYNNEPFYILSMPAPTIPLVTALGTAANYHNNGIGDDWALININSAWRSWVDPNMAYVGGPSCSTWIGTGVDVKHVGHGIQTGVIFAVPRVSVASTSNGNSFSGEGAISGGDSGSGMIQHTGETGCAAGRAAGIVTHCASIDGVVCLPLFWASDIRIVPATVTVGFDPI